MESKNENTLIYGNNGLYGRKMLEKSSGNFLSRHGIQEVGGLFLPIAKSLISNEIRLFYFVSLNMFFQAGADGGFLRFTPLV